MGSPMESRHTISASIAYPLNTPIILVTARTYPKNVAPVSPINISAGLKFLGKNPRQLPASAAVNITADSVPVRIHNTIRHMDAMEDTPAASPSRPSIRLTAFVTPIIHISVIGPLSF